KDRKFPAWLPEDRILEELTQRPINIGDNIELPFADSLLPEVIMRSEVLFNESEVRTKPCRTYQLKADATSMRFTICDSTVSLVAYQESHP
ncbi:hypothetical protein ACFLR1_07275, partial [Bacteroidota bacterium]